MTDKDQDRSNHSDPRVMGEEFVNEFQQDPQTAAHLVDAKRYYRKLKTGIIAGVGFLYLGAFILVTAGFDLETDVPSEIFGVAGLIIFISTAILALLYADIYRHEITDDELVLHEFAQAISEYDKDPPEYSKWEKHLSNALVLISHHDARVFSKFRRDQVHSYISWVKRTQGDNPSKANFEQFIHSCLYDLVEERNTDFEWQERYDSSDAGAGGFISVIAQSAKNIAGRSMVRNWVPVLAVLAIGFTIFFTYDEQLGSIFTIALLTVISIVRSQSD